MFLRLIPLFVPFSLLLLAEVFFFFPKMLFVILVLSLLLIFFSVWRLALTSKVDRRWWNYSILPAAFSAAILVYAIFLTDKTVIQLLFVLNAVTLYFYLRSVYYYLTVPEKYITFSIENISSFANLLSFFLISAVIYGLQSFLDFSVAYSAIAMSLFVILMFYQNIWASKISWRAGLSHLLIGCLVLIELVWAISFLPLNYNIAGITLTIYYYVIVGLAKNYLNNQLKPQTIKIYWLFGITSLIILLATADWF